MDNKVIITSDSTCDLPEEICEKLNIKILGLWVCFGDKMVRDGEDEINEHSVYDYYNTTGKLATTSALSIEEYKSFFKQFTDQGYSVIHINISSELSSTHQNAKLAASELPNVYVVDSRHLSSGQGLLAIKCAELALEGKSAQEIFDYAETYKTKISTSFVIDTLLYLSKGGRCSTLAYYGASLMKIKPTIVMPEGKLIVGKKYRGNLRHVLLEYIKDTLTPDKEYELDRIFITHTAFDDPTILEDMKRQVLKIVPFKEVHIMNAGSVIASHCGPNTAGILFVTK